mmetsp:Transcript_84973/g.166260  ORF Transcript_84973/g.166260 Transcript_84973/m.166260 type:complete len:219 (+) Transcript_84973:263-919(+)
MCLQRQARPRLPGSHGRRGSDRSRTLRPGEVWLRIAAPAPGELAVVIVLLSAAGLGVLVRDPVACVGCMNRHVRIQDRMAILAGPEGLLHPNEERVGNLIVGDHIVLRICMQAVQPVLPELMHLAGPVLGFAEVVDIKGAKLPHGVAPIVGHWPQLIHHGVAEAPEAFDQLARLIAQSLFRVHVQDVQDRLHATPIAGEVDLRVLGRAEHEPDDVLHS